MAPIPTFHAAPVSAPPVVSAPAGATRRGVADPRILAVLGVAVVAVVIALVIGLRPDSERVTTAGGADAGAPASTTASQNDDPIDVTNTSAPTASTSEQTGVADRSDAQQLAYLMDISAASDELDCLAQYMDPAWNDQLAGGDFGSAADISYVLTGCVRSTTLASSITAALQSGGNGDYFDLSCVESNLAQADAATWNTIFGELFASGFANSNTLGTWMGGCEW